MKILKKLFLWFLYFCIVFTLFTVTTLFLFKWIDPPTTAFIQSKSTSTLLASTNDYQNEWISLDVVSPYIPLAFIAAEDQRFFVHNGFDFDQINKALNEIETGRRVRGASTITQQVAKNLFLWETKSIVRKGIEAYLTVLIELVWTKQRILEVYINTAEFGKNIYGIESASQNFFNKSAELIDPTEAALAATVLPNPSKRNLWKY